MHTIHELAAQGMSLHAIARQLGLARNTVRKYVRGAAVPAARPAKPQKLDPRSSRRSATGCSRIICSIVSPCLNGCAHLAIPVG